MGGFDCCHPKECIVWNLNLHWLLHTKHPFVAAPGHYNGEPKHISKIENPWTLGVGGWKREGGGGGGGGGLIVRVENVLEQRTPEKGADRYQALTIQAPNT